MFKTLKYERWFLAAVAVVLSLLSLTDFFQTPRDKLIDLLFIKRVPSNKIVLLKIDEVSLQSVGQWPWPRAVFANLISKPDIVSVIGIDVNFKEPSRWGEGDDAALEQAIEKSKIPVVLTSEITSLDPVVIARPLTRFDQASMGYANAIVSSDGVARRFWPKILNEPSFSVAMANQFGDFPITLPKARLNFVGPTGTFPSFSALDFLENKIPKKFLENKVVIIGVTAKDLQDFHHTPFGLMSGAEWQANALETIISQKFLKDISAVWIFLITLLLGGVTILVSLRIKKLFSLIGAILLILIIYNLTAFLSFDRGLVFDLFYPNLAVVAGAVLSVAVQYVSTAREKKFIQETFSRYLAPEVIRELVTDPSRLKLGGQRKELSILFSDIRDFTSMSEKMSPEQLTEFMGEYLTCMTNVVLEYRGVVDKYIGDAVMAFWGAPVPEKDHAWQAVAAALAMLKELEKFNEENRKKGWPEIKIGVGINSGEVVVGNMGSEKRFDYTVIGDNVNIASRLEGLNKTYQTKILISEATAKKVEDRVALKDLDLVQVKGRQEPIRIFEVLGEKENRP